MPDTSNTHMLPCCINCKHHKRTYFNHQISIKCNKWNKTVKNNERCDYYEQMGGDNGNDLLSKHD